MFANGIESTREGGVSEVRKRKMPNSSGDANGASRVKEHVDESVFAGRERDGDPPSANCCECLAKVLCHRLAFCMFSMRMIQKVFLQN